MSDLLGGFRVLDLTSVVVGPYCTQALGDMGADVIKVESPQGDNLRYIGPRRNRGMSSQFLGLNRNKRSIVLDLKQPRGRDVLLRLVRTSDVLVHNVRMAAIRRLGLDYPAVREANPRIVYCTINGYRQDGPYAEKAAYDDTVQGASGLAAIQARAGEAPRYVVSAVGDKTPAMVATSSILAALLYRERTGQGQAIEVPMFESMVAYVMSEHLYGAMFDPPLGPMVYDRQTSPFRRPFATRSGYICVIVYTDEQWARFFQLIGQPELRTDPRFATFERRTENIDTLYSIVDGIVATRTSEEWLSDLASIDIPAMPLNRPGEVIGDQHLAAIEFFRTVEHPTEGRIVDVGQPVVYSAAPTTVRGYAPRLGEHSREVLCQAGVTEDEIAALAEQGVIRADRHA